MPRKLLSAICRTVSPYITLALLVAGGLASFCKVAEANVGEAYGFGSRTAGLAGAGVAWGWNGFAAYSNPAAIAFPTGKRMTLAIGLLYMDPHFKPIENVVVENEYTSDQLRQGNVDTSYRETLGEVLGVTYDLLPEFHHFSFGLTGFLPVNQVAYMDTGETYIPEYFLYRSRTQRPQFEAGFGVETLPKLYFGLGVHVGYSLTSNATVFLQADTNKPSHMRYTGSLKPKVAPYFGLLYSSEGRAEAPAARAADPKGSYSLGAVLRLPLEANTYATLNSSARAFANLSSLDFNFVASSVLFYDPLTVELGGSWQYLAAARIFAQLDYQRWSRFEAPALVISPPTESRCEGGACGIVISGSKNPSYEFQDIVIPRIGHELNVTDAFVLRAGYAYRQSILKSVPAGAGNYLDPSKHMMSLGAGFKFQSFLGFATPCTLDTHLAWHHLVTQSIRKDPGDERGQGSGDLKIGAPGYEAGGNVYGGGISLTLAF